ncbi:MAG: tetratricopeptide repeat protein [Vampirovibrionia bacterium]
MQKRFIQLILIMLVFLNVQPQSFAVSGDFERGKSAYKSGNYTLATQYFRRALSNNPSNTTYRYYLAQVLVQSKNLDEAQKEYQRIIQMSPYSQEATYSKKALVQIKDYIHNSLHPKWRSMNSNMDIGVSETHSKADVGDNYIDKVTEKGEVIRWQKSSMPLKVYVENDPRKVQKYSNQYYMAAKKGLEKWTSGTKGLITFRYVDSPQNADIKVVWKTVLDAKLLGSEAGTAYTAGVTSPEYSGKELYAMSVVLTTTDPNGKPHDPSDIEKVSTHEVGHALGIMGHSLESGDIMYANSKSNGELTKRDISTITLLYDLDPDISNFRAVGGVEVANASKDTGENDKSINEEVLGTKDQRIQTEIDEIMDAIKNNPRSSVNHINLGNLYGDQGEYDQAIREYKKALKLNPKSDIAYSNIGAMHQNLHQPYDALRAYTEAKKLNPKKPKPYLQIAIIAEGLNQKAEAIMSLKEYLVLNPKAQEDPEVLSLMKKLNFNQ